MSPRGKAPDFDSGIRRFKSCHPSHVGASFVSLALIFLQKSERTHAAAPPFRKKSRWLRLCPCERGHDASAALPTFCGMLDGSNLWTKNIRNSFYLIFTRRSKADFAPIYFFAYGIKTSQPSAFLLLLRKKSRSHGIRPVNAPQKAGCLSTNFLRLRLPAQIFFISPSCRDELLLFRFFIE